MFIDLTNPLEDCFPVPGMGIMLEKGTKFTLFVSGIAVVVGSVGDDVDECVGGLFGSGSVGVIVKNLLEMVPVVGGKIAEIFGANDADVALFVIGGMGFPLRDLRLELGTESTEFEQRTGGGLGEFR